MDVKTRHRKVSHQTHMFTTNHPNVLEISLQQKSRRCKNSDDYKIWNITLKIDAGQRQKCKKKKVLDLNQIPRFW